MNGVQSVVSTIYKGNYTNFQDLEHAGSLQSELIEIWVALTQIKPVLKIMFIMCKLWEKYRERSKKSQIFEIILRIFLFTIFPEVVGTYLRRETYT